jgi:hypothetical protein
MPGTSLGNLRSQRGQELAQPASNVTLNVPAEQPPLNEPSSSNSALPSLGQTQLASSVKTPIPWYAHRSPAGGLARNTDARPSVRASFALTGTFADTGDDSCAENPAIATPVRYAGQGADAQPGNTERGTEANGNPRPSMSDAYREPLVPGAQYAQAVVQQNDAVTGNPRIDRATERLLAILADTVQSLGPGMGPIFGIQAHVEFERRVKELNIPGIRQDGIEQSFNLGEAVEYGLAGSVRTDIVLRDRFGIPVAVYDLKIGNAKLTPSRVRELRRQVGQGNIPVIELRYGSQSAVLK